MIAPQVSRRVLVVGVLALAFDAAAGSAQAEVITGNIVGSVESGPSMTIGDGVNDVHGWWSLNTVNKGWFYGSAYNAAGRPVDDVAHAAGVTDISQIVDASALTFSTGTIGPFCDAQCDPDLVGEFIVWRNAAGFYGVLRIDDIYLEGGQYLLNGTWWFQTDGTPNFSSAGSVSCEIELSAASYGDGETVSVSTLRFLNPGTNPVAVEYKVWLEVPGVATPFSFIRGGAEGSVVFPGGLDVNLGPFPFFEVSPNHPRGAYNLSCRLLDPVTGALKDEDLNTFELQ